MGDPIKNRPKRWLHVSHQNWEEFKGFTGFSGNYKANQGHIQGTYLVGKTIYTP